MEDINVLGLKNGQEAVNGRYDNSEGVGREAHSEGDPLVGEWDEGGEEEEADNDRVSLGLIGRLWTNRNPNPTAFISTMKTVWTVKYGVELVNIGRNLYQIQFFHWRDKKKILDGQPWHFDKFPLLLEEIDTTVKPSDLEIVYLPLWARFYDIPFKGRGNEANARMLGDKLGEYMEMAKGNGCSIEKSVRVRVKIDVRQPLRDKVQLKIRGGKFCDIPVKYERLPLVCFYYGRLGHGMNDCVEVGGDCTPEQKFGPSLRASPWKSFGEDSSKSNGGSGMDGGSKLPSRRYITKKVDEAIRLEGKKLVDEVADFFTRVSLAPKDEGGLNNHRTSSVSSQELIATYGEGSMIKKGVVEEDRVEGRTVGGGVSVIQRGQREKEGGGYGRKWARGRGSFGGTRGC